MDQILKKKVSDVDQKITDVSDLVKKTDFNAKITEVERKISDVSSLITKTNFNTKVTEIEGNLVTKTDFDPGLKKISYRVTSNKTFRST